MPLSASSEESSTGKKRGRISLACARCRSRKIKCNGVDPCANCSKFGHECVYRPVTADENAAAKFRKLYTKTQGIPMDEKTGKRLRQPRKDSFTSCGSTTSSETSPYNTCQDLPNFSHGSISPPQVQASLPIDYLPPNNDLYGFPPASTTAPLAIAPSLTQTTFLYGPPELSPFSTNNLPLYKSPEPAFDYSLESISYQTSPISPTVPNFAYIDHGPLAPTYYGQNLGSNSFFFSFSQ